MKNNKLAVLSYVFGFISGIIILYIQRKDEFVRLSAAQSTVFSISAFIIYFICMAIPYFGGIVSACIAFITFVAWVFLMVRASENVYFKLPFISKISEKYVINFFK